MNSLTRIRSRIESVAEVARLFVIMGDREREVELKRRVAALNVDLAQLPGGLRDLVLTWLFDRLVAFGYTVTEADGIIDQVVRSSELES